MFRGFRKTQSKGSLNEQEKIRLKKENFDSEHNDPTEEACNSEDENLLVEKETEISENICWEDLEVIDESVDTKGKRKGFTPQEAESAAKSAFDSATLVERENCTIKDAANNKISSSGLVQDPKNCNDSKVDIEFPENMSSSKVPVEFPEKKSSTKEPVDFPKKCSSKVPVKFFENMSSSKSEENKRSKVSTRPRDLRRRLSSRRDDDRRRETGKIRKNSAEEERRMIEWTKFTRIVIVEDARLELQSASLSEKINLKVQVISKPFMTLENIPPLIKQHVEKSSERTLFICCAGIGNLVKFQNFSACSQLENHVPCNNMYALDKDYTAIAKGMCNMTSFVRKALKNMYGNDTEVIFSSVIPVDFFMYQLHQINVHEQETHHQLDPEYKLEDISLWNKHLTDALMKYNDFLHTQQTPFNMMKLEAILSSESGNITSSSIAKDTKDGSTVSLTDRLIESLAKSINAICELPPTCDPSSARTSVKRNSSGNVHEQNKRHKEEDNCVPSGRRKERQEKDHKDKASSRKSISAQDDGHKDKIIRLSSGRVVGRKLSNSPGRSFSRTSPSKYSKRHRDRSHSPTPLNRRDTRDRRTSPLSGRIGRIRNSSPTLSRRRHEDRARSPSSSKSRRRNRTRSPSASSSRSDRVRSPYRRNKRSDRRRSGSPGRDERIRSLSPLTSRRKNVFNHMNLTSYVDVRKLEEAFDREYRQFLRNPKIHPEYESQMNGFLSAHPIPKTVQERTRRQQKFDKYWPKMIRDMKLDEWYRLEREFYNFLEESPSSMDTHLSSHIDYSNDHDNVSPSHIDYSNDHYVSQSHIDYSNDHDNVSPSHIDYTHNHGNIPRPVHRPGIQVQEELPVPSQTFSLQEQQILDLMIAVGQLGDVILPIKAEIKSLQDMSLTRKSQGKGIKKLLLEDHKEMFHDIIYHLEAIKDNNRLSVLKKTIIEEALQTFSQFDIRNIDIIDIARQCVGRQPDEVLGYIRSIVRNPELVRTVFEAVKEELLIMHKKMDNWSSNAGIDVHFPTDESLTTSRSLSEFISEMKGGNTAHLRQKVLPFLNLAASKRQTDPRVNDACSDEFSNRYQGVRQCVEENMSIDNGDSFKYRTGDLSDERFSKAPPVFHPRDEGDSEDQLVMRLQLMRQCLGQSSKGSQQW